MKNQKLIKGAALACSLFILAGSMSGCKSGSEKAAETTQPASTVVTQKTDPYEKHLKYTISQVTGDQAGKEKDGSISANYEYFTKKFNIEFEWIPLTWANYVDQTRTWLAAGDAPDLIMLDIAPKLYPEYLNWVENGLFKPYPDLNQFPNMKKTMDKMVTGKKFIVDGKVYAWPAYMNGFDKYNYVGTNGFIYRRDWAEKLGLAKPNDEYTWDEWYNLVKQVVTKDPGGLGAGKTIGIIGADWMFPKFFGPGSVSPYLMEYTKGNDGKWVWGPTLPESLEAVKLARKMYDDGLVWKDQIMAKTQDASDKFSAGQLFARALENTGVKTYKNIFDSFKKANPNVADVDKTIGFALVKGPDGKLQTRQKADQWSQQAMNAKISDEKALRWTQAVDWILSEEGMNFALYGVPEKDWAMENGKPVVKWPKDANGTLVKPYTNGTVWWQRAMFTADGIELIDPGFAGVYQDRINAVLKRLNEPDVKIIKANPDLNYFSAPNYNKVGNKETEIYQQIAKLMVSPNLEKDWNDWIASKMKEIQPALDELNAQLK